MKIYKDQQIAKFLDRFESRRSDVSEDVERSVQGKRPVSWYGKCGGEVPTPEEIIDVVKESGLRYVSSMAMMKLWPMVNSSLRCLRPLNRVTRATIKPTMNT